MTTQDAVDYSSTHRAEQPAAGPWVDLVCRHHDDSGGTFQAFSGLVALLETTSTSSLATTCFSSIPRHGAGSPQLGLVVAIAGAAVLAGRTWGRTSASCWRCSVRSPISCSSRTTVLVDRDHRLQHLRHLGPRDSGFRPRRRLGRKTNIREAGEGERDDDRTCTAARAGIRQAGLPGRDSGGARPAS